MDIREVRQVVPDGEAFMKLLLRRREETARRIGMATRRPIDHCSRAKQKFDKAVNQLEAARGTSTDAEIAQLEGAVGEADIDVFIFCEVGSPTVK